MDSLLAQFHSLVDVGKTSLYLSLLAIMFNPAAWNIVARNEYRNKTITHIFGDNPKYGCYFLAMIIFCCGILRDQVYYLALLDQPQKALLPEEYKIIVPAALSIIGQMLVITSTWALGITGTFLGDYFGILKDHRVERFPFNVLRDPMYVGSTMCYTAAALWYERPAGLFISVYVYIIYFIALCFEGPFTDMIYSRRVQKTKA